MIRTVQITTDFADFYSNNEPDSTGILLELYNSVDDLTDVTFFNTTKVNKGKIEYIVTAASGDQLLLTAKSRQAFLRYIADQNPDPELDLEERANFEYSLNNPHA